MSKLTDLSNRYKFFCQAEGNQHIASEYSIKKLFELVEKFEVKSVLEVGLGIGSICGSLLKVKPELNYYGTEANEFCLKALKENLGQEYSNLNVFKDLSRLPEKVKFNLVIIDGQDGSLDKIKNLITNHGVIVIEGDRKLQEKILKNLFPEHRYVHCISRHKNRSESPFSEAHWQGGVKIVFIHPDSSQIRWWGIEKIKTKLKYLYRSYLD